MPLSRGRTCVRSWARGQKCRARLVERIAVERQPRLVVAGKTRIAELVRVRRTKYTRISPGEPHRQQRSVVQETKPLNQTCVRRPESPTRNRRDAFVGIESDRINH